MARRKNDIAESLDDLLRQLATSNSENLPVAGQDSEYDTRRGWRRRLGIGKDRSNALILMLLKDGRAEEVPGMYQMGMGLRKITLVKSATLKAACE